MKLSIRVKLVASLALVALLPLVAAVLIMAIGGRELRIESIGRGIQSVAAAKALGLQVSLSKDIEKLHLALEETSVISAVETDRRFSGEELEELDALWAMLPLTDPRISAVLNNPAARELRRIETEDPRFAEILVTDRHGRLVAATNRTSDFYKSDEDWWGEVSEKEGRVSYVPPVNYDSGSKVWSIDLCVPIIKEGRLIGVGKAVLDVSRLMIEPSVTIGEVRASVMFARNDGRIIYRDNTEPLTESVVEWSGWIGASRTPQWRVTRDGRIQARAPMHLTGKIAGHEVETPRWFLLLSVAKADVVSAVDRLTVAVVGIGLAIIAFIFLGGLFMVDRVVLRRIYRLRRASRRIAEGDLGYRIGAPGTRKVPLIGPDEIDELTDDFNDMVSRMQRSHEQLITANELKTSFIRIAGHELRTPVSYILGMVRLLKDNRDPSRLLHAIQSMGAKAKRLDEIIQSMFKLMRDQRHVEMLHYGDVKITELLEEVHLDCFPFVERRNQRLTIETPEKIETIRADREKLRNVLENLVMNAIKFTPDGGSIRLRVGHQLGGYVSITVEDQGPGIPEGDLPHIFEPFYSGGDVMRHSSGRSGYEKRGMGLGLAIVRRFVELHGGTVSVTSDENGSTFTVLIPAQPPPRPEQATT